MDISNFHIFLEVNIIRIMEFSRSKFILKQAQFFLDKINEVYSTDYIQTEHYLNAFLNSCKSTFDYSIRDFLHSIKPPIDEDYIYQISRNKSIKKNEEIKNLSPETIKLIQGFLSYHSKLFLQLRKQPLVCYLLEKRNFINHHGPSGFKQERFEGEYHERKTTGRNFLQLYDQVMYSFDKKKIPIEIKLCKLCEDETSELIEQLISVDGKRILSEYLLILKKFVSDLELQEYSNLIDEKQKTEYKINFK